MFGKPKQRMAALKTQATEASAKAQEAAKGAGRGALGVAQRIDDATQAFARNQLLQLPTDGSMLPEGAFMRGPRNALGSTVFTARRDYAGDNTQYRGTGTTNDNIGLALGRALQGGTITAAGAGLAALTTQFGSQADYQEPNQLSM